MDQLSTARGSLGTSDRDLGQHHSRAHVFLVVGDAPTGRTGNAASISAAKAACAESEFAERTADCTEQYHI